MNIKKQYHKITEQKNKYESIILMKYSIALFNRLLCDCLSLSALQIRNRERCKRCWRIVNVYVCVCARVRECVCTCVCMREWVCA